MGQVRFECLRPRLGEVAGFAKRRLGTAIAIQPSAPNRPIPLRSRARPSDRLRNVSNGGTKAAADDTAGEVVRFPASARAGEHALELFPLAFLAPPFSGTAKKVFAGSMRIRLKMNRSCRFDATITKVC